MREGKSKNYRFGGLLAAFAVVFILAAGCQQLTPEEQLVEARSKYEATLNNFIVTQVPLVEEMPVEEGEEAAGEAGAIEADDAAAEGAGEAEEDAAEGEAIEDVPVRQDVTVDLTIRHESDPALDGITVDFYMSDGDLEIQNWKIWFDTAAVPANTPGVQFSHTFEDVDYQDGYGFAAEIRSPVPVGERGDYREFSDL